MWNGSQRPELPSRSDRPPLSKAGSIQQQQPQQPQIPKQPIPRPNQQAQNQQPQNQKPRYKFKPLGPPEIPYRTPKNQIALFRREQSIAHFNANLQRADPARMAALNALSDTEPWKNQGLRGRWKPGDTRNDYTQAYHEWLEAVRNRPGLWKKKTGCEFGFIDDSDTTGKLKGCAVC